MRIIGLTTDPNIQRYLRDAYDLALESADPVPLFKKSGEGDEYFFGGIRSFYAVATDAKPGEIDALMRGIKKSHPNCQSLVSVPFDDGRSKLAQYMLDCRTIGSADSRFETYEKKTRNLVRKSYKNEFRLEVGPAPEAFYPLYENSIRRLGGLPKTRRWFSLLERHAGENVVAFSLYDGSTLIAANYCIQSPDYIFLMFNVSNPAYWEFAVNDRLYDELIRWALEQGISYVDFGPSVRSDLSHGHFKAGFGAQRRSILTIRLGTFWYRFRQFIGQKRHNLKLKLASKR